MSVKQESIDMKSTERKPEAPELEYKAASQDSLSMFFAAIGGAVLGMLATLLVLALVNGGTLNFIHPERLAVLEENLTLVNENVGAVSANVDNVAQQVEEIRTELGGASNNMQTAVTRLDEHDARLTDVSSSVTALQLTGQRFDTFVTALDEALTSMDRVGAANGVSAAAGAPVVVSSADVPAGDVAVLFFADANANSRLDDSEANLVGLQLAVTNAEGASVGDYSSTDGGIVVEGLAPGQYTFTVSNAAGYTLRSADTVTVNVPQSGEQGQVVYFSVAE